MTFLPYEANFPLLGTRASVLTSNRETLLPAVEIIRAEMDVFGHQDPLGGHPLLDAHLGAMLHGTDPMETVSPSAERNARSATAQRLADLLADELPGGFLVDIGGIPAVAGESLAAAETHHTPGQEFSSAA